MHECRGAECRSDESLNVEAVMQKCSRGCASEVRLAPEDADLDEERRIVVLPLLVKDHAVFHREQQHAFHATVPVRAGQAHELADMCGGRNEVLGDA